jgi:hypothetical protein
MRLVSASGRKIAAEIKSSTAARRAAMRSGDSGSPGMITLIIGVLEK